MINSLLEGVFNFIVGLINSIIEPIDLLIQNNIPELASALASFGNLIDYIINFIGYCIDATGLSSFALSLIVLYLSFALTVPVIVWVIKVVVKWWHMLAP